MSAEFQGADSLALLRLLQLSSPLLPIGSYTFSQGLEWAVHAGWVLNEQELSIWLGEQLQGPVTLQELPLLSRLIDAFHSDNQIAAQYWSQFALACRESSEFREEERDRAAAMFRVLEALSVENIRTVKPTLLLTPLAGFACAAVAWSIPQSLLLQAYAFAWLENQIAAGVKLVPLGQSQGQRLLFTLAEMIPDVVAAATDVNDDEIGYSCLSISQAGCLHETQYSRLYRS